MIAVESIILLVHLIAGLADAVHSAFPNGFRDAVGSSRPYHRHFTALRSISRKTAAPQQNQQAAPAKQFESMGEELMDLPVYGDLEALKSQLDEFTPIGQGKRGIVHRAHVTSDRLLNRGKVIKSGTGIALKTVPAHMVNDEVQALTRLAVLREYGVTDLFPEVYGIFFSQHCNIMPKRRGRRQRQIVPGFDDVSCATIELELVDKTFLDMFYNRRFFDEKEHAFYDNSMVQPVPDTVVLELILGEMAAATYAGISVVDRNPGNYAVKHVNHWRSYKVITGTGSVEFSLPPGPSARRIDCGIWQNIADARRDGQDPLSFFKNSFAKQYLVSDKAANALKELSDTASLTETLSVHFADFLKGTAGLLDETVQTFEMEI